MASRFTTPLKSRLCWRVQLRCKLMRSFMGCLTFLESCPIWPSFFWGSDLRHIVLELDPDRNVQCFIIVRAERCTHGEAAPNSLFALKEHPRSVSLPCIVRGHLYPRIISVNLLYRYMKSRDYGMCCHILF